MNDYMNDFLSRKLLWTILRKNWVWFLLAFLAPAFASSFRLENDSGMEVWNRYVEARPSIVLLIFVPFILIWKMGRYYLETPSRDVVEALPISRKGMWNTGFMFLFLLGLWYFFWCYQWEDSVYNPAPGGIPWTWLFSRYFAYACVFLIVSGAAVIALCGVSNGREYAVCSVIFTAILASACIVAVQACRYEVSGSEENGRYIERSTCYIGNLELPNVLSAVCLGGAAIAAILISRYAFLRRRGDLADGSGMTGGMTRVVQACGLALVMLLVEVNLRRRIRVGETNWYIGAALLTAVFLMCLPAIFFLEKRHRGNIRGAWKGIVLGLGVFLVINLIMIAVAD